MKKEEFNSKDLESVWKVLTVLKYLNQGRELKLGDIPIMVGETKDGGFQLLTKVLLTTTDNPEPRERWMGLFWTLSDFSEECNKLTEEDITIMIANIMSLQDINSRK